MTWQELIEKEKEKSYFKKLEEFINLEYENKKLREVIEFNDFI